MYLVNNLLVVFQDPVVGNLEQINLSCYSLPFGPVSMLAEALELAHVPLVYKAVDGFETPICLHVLINMQHTMCGWCIPKTGTYYF